VQVRHDVTSYQLAAGDPLTLLHFGEATTVSPAPTPCPAAHHRCRRSDPGLRPRPNPQAGNHGAAATEVASTRGKDHREWGRDPVDIRAYGRFTADGRTVRASRFLWTAHHGPLPPNTVVMHQVCDEPSCVRLADVRAGSQAENLATAARRDRSSGWRHTGRADRRGMAARSRAIRAALAGGYDPDRLAAVLTAGDCPRPPGPVGRAVLTGLRPTLAAWIAAEHSGPRRTTALHRRLPARDAAKAWAQHPHGHGRCGTVSPCCSRCSRRRPEHGVVAAPARPPHQRLGPARRPGRRRPAAHLRGLPAWLAVQHPVTATVHPSRTSTPVLA